MGEDESGVARVAEREFARGRFARRGREEGRVVSALLDAARKRVARIAHGVAAAQAVARTQGSRTLLSLAEDPRGGVEDNTGADVIVDELVVKNLVFFKQGACTGVVGDGRDVTDSVLLHRGVSGRLWKGMVVVMGECGREWERKGLRGSTRSRTGQWG